MTTLDNLEKLADAAMVPMNDVMFDAMNPAIEFRSAANPQTIKQLIALCRMQNAALNYFKGDHWFWEQAGEAIAAYEAFNKEGE